MLAAHSAKLQAVEPGGAGPARRAVAPGAGQVIDRREPAVTRIAGQVIDRLGLVCTPPLCAGTQHRPLCRVKCRVARYHINLRPLPHDPAPVTT